MAGVRNMKNRRLRGYDLNLIAVVSISTFALALERYHHVPLDFPRATELVYYVVLPLAASWLLFRDRPQDSGIRVGLWKPAIILSVLCLTVMTLILYWAARMPEFRSYYHMHAIDWPKLIMDAALYVFGWEFLFRGYMLFGLEKSMGQSAIFVQAIPFVLLHIGKPFLETLACIPLGFVLGFVAYRTRSFLPCFVIHFGIYVMMILFANC